MIMLNLKYTFFCFSITFFLLSCEKDDDNNAGNCGTKEVNGVSKQLQLGSQGGCFYENDSGNKIYVDRGDCKC